MNKMNEQLELIDQIVEHLSDELKTTKDVIKALALDCKIRMIHQNKSFDNVFRAWIKEIKETYSRKKEMEARGNKWISFVEFMEDKEFWIKYLEKTKRTTVSNDSDIMELIKKIPGYETNYRLRK